MGQETGFFKKLNPRGQYFVWFGSEERLYAVLLLWLGTALCDWNPEVSIDVVGFRGAIISPSADVKLVLPADLVDSDYKEPVREVRG
jgi:hypothetical protein